MDWVAFGAITNTILVAALVGVTIYYARQTKLQANSMQDQTKWERTFKPRLDAYTRFIEIMSKRPFDTPYQLYVIVPQLELIQPFSSVEVEGKAKELYEIAKSEMRMTGNVPGDLATRIINELNPIVNREITEITRGIPSP